MVQWSSYCFLQLRIFLLSLSIFLFLQVNAQQGETRILENKQRLIVRFDSKTNEPEITEEYTRKTLFGTDHRAYSEDRIYYNEFDLIDVYEIDALVPEKGKMKSKKLEYAKRIDVMENGIFYSGYRALEFRYPRIVPASIGQLYYTRKISDPHFLNPFYFQTILPTEKAVFEVETDKNIQINCVTFGITESNCTYSKNETESTFIHRWEMKNTQPFEREPDAPSSSYTIPHIVPMVESVNGNPILKSVDDLYQWYSGLVAQIPKAEPEQMKVLENFTKELITDVEQQNPDLKGEQLKREKIRTLYDWVRKNVKYIAVEDGMEGFIPRNSYKVYEKRYGDCKDMANLLSTMLNMASLEGSLVWIGTRSKPYNYNDLPCTLTDNHMICYAGKLDGKPLMLDATDEHVPFPLPSAFTQGKQALVQKGDSYELIELPEIAPEQNVRMDSSVLQITESNLIGVTRIRYDGYQSEFFSLLKGKLDSEKKLNGVYLGYQEADLINVQFDSINDSKYETAPFFAQISIPYKVTSTQDKLYVNPNIFVASLPDKVDLLERKSPLFMRTKNLYVRVTELILPEGYEVDFLPENVRKPYEFFGYERSFQTVGNKIIMEEKLTINFLLLEQPYFKDWNRFVDLLRKYSKEVIVLKKTS